MHPPSSPVQESGTEAAFRAGYKPELIERLFSDFAGTQARVLDLGCGTCANFADPLRRHPNIAYTGVEANPRLVARAQATVGDLANVEVLEAFGETFSGSGYDLVITLSVLEHVKRLDDFLAVSVRAARSGGRVVHRYDLGHALFPSTWGERLRVAVARRIPALVPAQRFTTYPDLSAVLKRLRELGLHDIDVSQSQLPSLKKATNLIDDETPEGRDLSARVVDLDSRLWAYLGDRLDGSTRDALFPAVTISGYA